MKIYDPKGLLNIKTVPMDAEIGRKVTVTDQSIDFGYDNEIARKHLKVGDIYTIEGMDVQAWSSTLWVREIPGIEFNTVNFVDIN